MLWAAGLVEPAGEVLLKTTRSEGRPLWSLDIVGREGRALLVDGGSFLVSLGCDCGTTSIMAPVIRIYTSWSVKRPGKDSPRH